MNATIPLTMPADLRKEVRRLAQELQVSQSDLLSQCIRFGLPQFRRQFQPADDYLHPPIMTPSQARRLFRPDPTWEAVEAALVKRFHKALKPEVA